MCGEIVKIKFDIKEKTGLYLVTVRKLLDSLSLWGRAGVGVLGWG
jgi:hypothetical protein